MFESGIEFIDEYIRPRYKCIKAYQTINVGDKVSVAISLANMHNQVYVSANRHAYFMTHATLDKHFIKE